MNVFNSLGSNYTFRFVLTTFLTKNEKKAFSRLKTYLENKYHGEVHLVYKGREAIELALQLLSLPKGSVVAFNGFTCFAVYNAVTKSGLIAEYIDIADRDLNFSAETFRGFLKKNPSIKVLLIQNTLGYPCDIEAIAKICKEHSIILIEDLAHSIGAKYKNNEEAGTIGDFTILSFSQDKMIDGISGGALIIRNEKFKGRSVNFKKLENKKQIIDKLYPFFTFLIRKTYPSGFGKILHEILKRLHLLSNPMGENDELVELPSWYCSLVYQQFKELDKNLDHRRKIARIYAEKMDQKIVSKQVCENINRASNLRFPIFVSERANLISYLKRYGVFVSDIWYDAPIAPKKYMRLTNYTKQCPQSESISELIVNLPTHKNISEKQALEIANKINLWQTSR